MSARRRDAAAAGLVALAALVLTSTAPARAPTPCMLEAGDGSVVAQAGLRLAWRTLPPTIRNSEPFVLLLRVCPAEARLLRVDASMPEHRHGMNYRPSLQPLGDGRWRAEGLLWHMAGRWEWRFELALGERIETLRSSVDLP